MPDRKPRELFLFGKLGMALFERAWSIWGMTQLMMDMHEAPRFVEELLDPKTYKEKYGRQLAFYGGIDVERTLPFGTPEEVRGEIRHMAEVMGHGGGYILQSSHTVLSDVPMENVVAYIEEVRRLAGIG